MRYQLTLIKMVIIKFTNNECWRGCREQGTFLHRWWECKLVHSLSKTVWRFLKKTKNTVAIWSSNPTPCIYLEKTISKRYMFKAAILTIAKTWKQPKCPSRDGWIKMWYKYTNGMLLGHKKEWNDAICSNTDWPRDYHTKVNAEKGNYCMIPLITWNLKIWNHLRNRNRLGDAENKLMVPKGEREWGGIN